MTNFDHCAEAEKRVPMSVRYNRRLLNEIINGLSLIVDCGKCPLDCDRNKAKCPDTWREWLEEIAQ